MSTPLPATMPSPPPPSAQSQRRPRWVLRIAFILLLLLIATITTYFFWGWRQEARFDRRIAEIAAAGARISPESFQPAIIDPDQNGYADIRRALSALPREDPQSPLARVRSDPRLPLFDDERVVMREAVEAERGALTAMAPAARKPYVIVDDLQYASPLIDTQLPDLKFLRRLARSAARAAALEYDAGRHRAAIETLRLVEPVAKGAASHSFLVGTLVAIGCRAIMADQVMQMAPELKIGTRAEAGEVPPELVAALIAELLDDSALKDELRAGFEAERAFQADIAQMLAQGRTDLLKISSPNRAVGTQPSMTWLTRYLARPLVFANANYALDFMTPLIPIASAPDWPTAKSQLGPHEAHMMRDTDTWRYTLVRILIPSLSRATHTHYRIVTERRLAATALAIRWYQCQHDGRLPESLDELIPRYLPSPPLDPMAAGKTFGYRNDPTAPAIWSMGEDGIDDGGSVAPTKPGRAVEPGDRWSAPKDVVVPLRLPPRQRSVLAAEE